MATIDTTGLANIYRGFPGGDYDEADACEWVLSNAEAILKTHDALRELEAALARKDAALEAAAEVAAQPMDIWGNSVDPICLKKLRAALAVIAKAKEETTHAG